MTSKFGTEAVQHILPLRDYNKRKIVDAYGSIMLENRLN